MDVICTTPLLSHFNNINYHYLKVPVPVVLKDILESSVVGIGSGTDYIPEMLIHENGRVGNKK